MREFETGATRDTEEGKLDFEGFLSPKALEAFATYMDFNRVQADGQLRASDNWQKGIPINTYVKSAWRHFFEVWKLLRGKWEATPGLLVWSLCALMFNVQGLLHEILKRYPDAAEEARDYFEQAREGADELTKPLSPA